MYIFDIDGTLADSRHRLHYIIGDKKDWDAYDAMLPSDGPIECMVELAQCMYMSGFDVMLLTGRSERTRKATEAWLKRYDVCYDYLLMRPLHDRREDTLVKLELLDDFLLEKPTDVATIFEDRARLVVAFRKAGFHVCQVAEGDF